MTVEVPHQARANCSNLDFPPPPLAYAQAPGIAGRDTGREIFFFSPERTVPIGYLLPLLYPQCRFCTPWIGHLRGLPCSTLHYVCTVFPKLITTHSLWLLYVFIIHNITVATTNKYSSEFKAAIVVIFFCSIMTKCNMRSLLMLPKLTLIKLLSLTG